MGAPSASTSTRGERRRVRAQLGRGRRRALGEAALLAAERKASAEQAAELAAQMLADTSAVVLKILSPDITHKSDVGGVRLNIATPEEAHDAAEAMIAQMASSGLPSRRTSTRASIRPSPASAFQPDVAGRIVYRDPPQQVQQKYPPFLAEKSL